MKTNLERAMTFFLVGMPRGGTTIVGRVLNSLEDGFCFGEPHWYWNTINNKNMQDVQRHCFGKVQEPPIHSDMDVIELLDWIEGRVQEDDYNLGGYKETWFSRNKMVRPLAAKHAEHVDFFIVLFRHPLQVHSSQWALGWKEARDPDTVIQGFKELDELARHSKAVPMVYERFAIDPLGYLNHRLPFQIEGELELQPTGHKYGDPYANVSKYIELHAREVCLPPEIAELHEETTAIWDHWSRL